MKKNIAKKVEDLLKKSPQNDQLRMIKELQQQGVIKSPSYELPCGPSLLQHRFTS